MPFDHIDSSNSLLCKKLEIDPGEYRDCFLAGAAGHSQGIVAAIVIALSWESFFENAVDAVSLMMSIGTYVGFTYPVFGTVSSAIVRDSVRNGEGRPFPMLQITGLSLGHVEASVAQANKDLLQNLCIAISLSMDLQTLLFLVLPDLFLKLNFERDQSPK